jgi:triacylglycerol lipase
VRRMTAWPRWILLALIVPGTGIAAPRAVHASPPAPASPVVSTATPPDTVVLLHGLGRSPRSMRRLERALATDGYRVVNVPFPTRRESVEELSRRLAALVAEEIPAGGGRVHFVTHSLGGIVVRDYLAHDRPANLGRVVMLSPPNGGCEIVDLLKRTPFLRNHVGPSRGELGTDAASPPTRLGPVDYEVGVIAGDRSVNPLFSWLLPGADDGVVAVERTKVAGMRDMVITPHGHTFIMNGRDTIAETLAFLRCGRFIHPPVASPESGRTRHDTTAPAA